TALLGLVLVLVDPLALQALRHHGFDQYQRWQPRSYEAVPVRIVDIDEESLDRIGKWPWSRHKLARLVAQLRAEGDSDIGINVVLGFALRNDGAAPSSQQPAPPAPYRFVWVGEPSPEALHRFSAAVPPLPLLGAAASGSGALTFMPDGDGVVRRVPLVMALAQ